MIFNTIVNEIKKKFGNPDNKNWISERLNEIEACRLNFDTLPFKIVRLKNLGFLTKVLGLYSYIPFNHMPWKYYSSDAWIAIAPSLIGKKFYCKIHKVDKDQNAIILNGELFQFKKAELVIGEEYKGLVINKTDFGVFVDIGYHFDWKYGSLTGLLHKSQLSDNEKMEDFTLGQKINTIYVCANDSGQFVFCNNQEKIDWQLGKPQDMVGQTIWAKVIRKPDSNAVDLLIKGRYKATIDKNAYDLTYWKEIKRAKAELKNGEIINCEVTGFNDKNRTLKINWLINIDTDIMVKNSISNNLDNETLEKLIALKNNT